MDLSSMSKNKIELPDDKRKREQKNSLFSFCSGSNKFFNIFLSLVFVIHSGWQTDKSSSHTSSSFLLFQIESTRMFNQSSSLEFTTNSNVGTTEESSVANFHRTLKRLGVFYMAMLIILGFIGNSLSCYVFIRSKLK